MYRRLFFSCVYLIMLGISHSASAKIACGDLPTNAATKTCLAEKNKAANEELDRYLKASKKSLKDRPKVLKTLERSQAAWLAFRKEDCGAISEFWAGGTIRGPMYAECLLKHTQRRTHDLWQSYLTPVD